MIALLANLAWGQCAQLNPLPSTIPDTVPPIAGTAGWQNARSAVRTAVATYGAGTFARRELRKKTVVALDMNTVANAARVPHDCGTFTAIRPFDLGTTSVGGRAKLVSEGPVRMDAFFASSVIVGTSYANGAAVLLPIMNLYPALAAPLTSGSFNQGVDAYTVDWLGGVNVRSEPISVQAGYTAGRGFYLDVTQDKTGLFGNGLVSDLVENGISPQSLAYLMGGVERFDAAKFGQPEKVGMSSLYARLLPQDAVAPDEEPTASTVLKTVHIAQEDLGNMVDVFYTSDAGRGFSPREASVAFHSTGYHVREDRQKEASFFVKAGVLNLPAQPVFGVDAGTLPTLKAEVRGGENADATLGIYINEPEVLDLFPFARNAVAVHIKIRVLEDI